MVSDARISPLLNRLGGLYRDPNRVDRDASSLLKSAVGQHLSPQIANLVENTGDSSTTLCLQGTISIHFRGQEYQQLMDIYLPPGYPARPPLCFVRLASPNMYLKENHAHVGTDGQVYLPYLHEWKGTGSHSLIELVVAMSSVFSADPPVFTRAAAPAPPPPPPPIPTSSYSSSAAGTVNSSFASSTNNNSNYDPDAMMQSALHESALEAAALQEEAREKEMARQHAQQEEWDAKNFAATKEKVRRKMYNSLIETRLNTQTSIQADMQDSKRLALSEERISSQMKELKESKKTLQEQMVVLEKATADITKFLEQVKEQVVDNKDEDGSTSIDDLVQPVSMVDEQMLKLSAENASYTDVLYFLDKALHNGSIDLSAHLKQVRLLSKKQFLVRAHLLKISQHRMENGG